VSSGGTSRSVVTPELWCDCTKAPRPHVGVAASARDEPGAILSKRRRCCLGGDLVRWWCPGLDSNGCPRRSPGTCDPFQVGALVTLLRILELAQPCNNLASSLRPERAP